MKYLCLIYGDETYWANLPKAEAEHWIGEYQAFNVAAKASGHYLGSNKLEPAAMSRTVRVRDGRISTTDGPFVETKEQLGGYYMLEAADLEEATAIAAKIPGAHYARVEIRPIAEYPGS